MPDRTPCVDPVYDCACVLVHMMYGAGGTGAGSSHDDESVPGSGPG